MKGTMSSSADIQALSPASEACPPAYAEVTWDSGDPSVGSQGLADFSLVEMTEVEYTHLQHIIYSQMEATEQNEPPDGAPDPGCDVQPARYGAPSPGRDDYAAAGTACSTRAHADGHDVMRDVQDVKAMPAAERTPGSCGEVPGHVLAKARAFILSPDRDCRGEPSAAPEVRRSPPARVRLEKRFASEVPLSSFLSALQHPTELLGVPSKPIRCFKMGQGKVTTSGSPGVPFALLGGGSQAQSLGVVPHTATSSKDGEVTLRRSHSFTFQPDSQPAKAACCSQTAAAAEPEGCVTLHAEDPAQQKPLLSLRRTRARLRQKCLERRTLSDIQNVARPGETAASVHKGRLKVNNTTENLQRRERHNNMERDRRRRIRICCDELNMLVPFCSVETDKATTLQWTTAFLKYIKEIYGDSLKQEFQNVFCGQTGKRIKHSRVSESVKPSCEPSSLHGVEPCEQNQGAV